MKKIKSDVRLFFLATILLIAGNFFSFTLWATEDDPDRPRKDVPEGVRVGYRASFEKTIVGYELEKFGWIGAEFSRLKPVYNVTDCCRYTGDKMDGCSAPLNCQT